MVMREYELEILEQYDIETENVRKGRGVYLLDTDKGLLLLQKAAVSERRMEQLEILGSYLIENGCPNIDQSVRNKEGKLVSTAEDGSRYVVKHWFNGRECNVQKDYEVVEAVKNLAYLHNILKVPPETETEFPWGQDLKEEFILHNRELKKVRNFIRKRPRKSEFEMIFLKYFEEMYEIACAVTQRLEVSRLKELTELCLKQKTITHGDYNYHNVLMLPSGIATVNFDNSRVDVQSADLYYFMRKLMEKHQWDAYLGEQIMRSYTLIRPVAEAEMQYLAIRLAYPEKFFKVANTYYQSNKARIPEKSIEKLLAAVRETEKKRRFLQDIFSFRL